MTEHQEQTTVVDQLRALGILVASVPNEGLRRHGGQFVQRGLLAGMPDLLIFTRAPARPEARGVALEMKARQRGKVAPEQARIHQRLRNEGWVVLVAHGANDALQQLQALGYQTQPGGPQHAAP